MGLVNLFEPLRQLVSGKSVSLFEGAARLHSSGTTAAAEFEHVRRIADGDFRMPMTIEAPLHVQRGSLSHQRHAIDATMAIFAPNPLGHMNAVVEVHEIGHVVHASPSQ